jgi:hypothetical protein
MYWLSTADILKRVRSGAPVKKEQEGHSIQDKVRHNQKYVC